MKTFKDLKEEIRGCSQYSQSEINRVKAISLILEESQKDTSNRLHDAEVIYKITTQLIEKYTRIYYATKNKDILSMLKFFETYKRKKTIDTEFIKYKLQDVQNLDFEKATQILQYEPWYEYVKYDQLIEAIKCIKE
jgi:hypothetical protein